MEDTGMLKNNIAVSGFAIIPPIYTATEIESLNSLIEKASHLNPGFQKPNDLFAIRRFLKQVPEAVALIFTNRLLDLISEVFSDDYMVVKSIYFDKPEQSNWFVAYHQDLTIAVNQKAEHKGYVNWTVKQYQFAVQPPLEILQHNFTLRIHLDDTDENNGALKVIPGSHLKGIYRPETIDRSAETEVFCKLKKGGVMIMRPLLMHASNKSGNDTQRRVIHIEFSNAILPKGMDWAERLPLQFPESRVYPPVIDTDCQ